jgi:hypothetical protein
MSPIPVSYLPPQALLLPGGAAPSAARRRAPIDFRLGPDRRYKLPREGKCVAQVPRAPGPAGPGTGMLLRRGLRERPARLIRSGR